jgi:hypothetical protein
MIDNSVLDTYLTVFTYCGYITLVKHPWMLNLHEYRKMYLYIVINNKFNCDIYVNFIKKVVSPENKIFMTQSYF